MDMKRIIIFSIGFIISVAIIFIMIFTGGSKQTISQPTLKETIIENNVDITETYEQETNEYIVEEAPQEDSITSKEERNDLPERITEVLETTWNFFRSNPFQIVAIGDSLTQGVGDVTKQGGYVGILDRTINVDEKLVQFENFGKRGNQSIQLLERLDEEEIQASIQKADMILITIGANDIMQVAKENMMNLQLEDFIEQREQFEQNLNGILNKIRELNEDSEVFLIGFYNPFERYFHDIKELDTIVKTYNGTTNKVANLYDGVTYIPTMDLFQDIEENNLLAEDNFHPNYLGYHKIAKRVLDYITNEES